MSLDQYFKELEVKSEKDLYKQSFRVALDSREALLEELQDEKKLDRKRLWAREALWFFGALFMGAFLGWVAIELLPMSLKKDLATTLNGLLSSASEKGLSESLADLGAEISVSLESMDFNPLDDLVGEPTAQSANAPISKRDHRLLYYGLSVLCFVGVYVSRTINWSLKSIAEERK